LASHTNSFETVFFLIGTQYNRLANHSNYTCSY